MTRVPCALCGRDEPALVRRREPFAIVRCRGCDLLYLSPRPAAQALPALYSRSYFESGDAARPGYRSCGNLAGALAREAADKLSVVVGVAPPPARLLDHGCGTGVFLEAAFARGYDAVGLDVSAYAVEQVRARGLPAQAGTLEDGWGADESFDIVTSWDVIEHVPDPRRTLASVRRVLRPGGYYVATTPNAWGLDARLLGHRWYGFTKVPEHSYFFTPATLGALLRDAGLAPVSVRRWGFVRDVAFGLDKLASVTGLAPLRWLAARLGPSWVGQAQLACPFIDMLVIARRVD